MERYLFIIGDLLNNLPVKQIPYPKLIYDYALSVA